MADEQKPGTPPMKEVASVETKEGASEAVAERSSSETATRSPTPPGAETVCTDSSSSSSGLRGSNSQESEGAERSGGGGNKDGPGNVKLRPEASVNRDEGQNGQGDITGISTAGDTSQTSTPADHGTGQSSEAPVRLCQRNAGIEIRGGAEQRRNLPWVQFFVPHRGAGS